MPQEIRVVCDYYAFPVWADVSMSTALHEEFSQWAEIYMGILKLDYENDENAWPTHLMEQEKWVAWGRSLALRLKAEVGPDYQINYLNEISEEWEAL
jgi:hypothetical protein